MAAGLVETDIDQFIRNQKAKLQQERNVLGDHGKDGRSSRKQWNKTQDNKYANQSYRPQSPEESGFPLTNDKAAQKKLELSKQRQKEYNELLQTQPKKRINRRVVTPETGLQFGSYDQKRKQYEDERKQDLKNAMAQKPVQAPRRVPPSRDRQPPPGQVRRGEKVTTNVQHRDERFRLRQKEPTPPFDGMKFGDYEDYKKRNEERKKLEYKHDLEQQVDEKRRKKAEQEHRDKVELAARHPFVPQDDDVRRMRREEERRKKLDRALAENQRPQGIDYSPRSRSPSPPAPQYESYIEERLKREAELRRQEEEAYREAEARRAYDEQLTERELHRQQELLQRQRLESLEDELREENKLPRGDPFRPAGLMPEERSKEYQRLTELIPDEEPKPQGEKKVFIEGQEKYDGKIKKLQDERNKEYNQLLAKQPPPKTSKREVREEEGGALLPLGGYENKRKQLEDERHKEMLQYMDHQDQQKRNRRGKTKVRSTPPPKKPKTPESDKNVSDYVLNKVYETEMRHFDEEKRELNEYLNRKQKVQQAEHKRRTDISPRGAIKRQDDLSPRARDSPDMVSKLGGYQRERAKLDEERKKDYNKLLEEQARALIGVAKRYATILDREFDEHTEALSGLYQGLTSVIDNDDLVDGYKTSVPPRVTKTDNFDEKFEASLPGLRAHESAEVQKLKKRNDEYNEYLREKDDARRRTDRRTTRQDPVLDKHAGANYRPTTEPVAGSAKKNKDVFATLPGLNYSESAETRKKIARNQEYNDLLHEKEEKEDLRKRKMELRNKEYNEYKIQKENEKLLKKEAELRDKAYKEYLQEQEKLNEFAKKEADLRQKAYEEYLRERDYWDSWNRGRRDYLDGRPGPPRKGWYTPPSYDEILEKKRREEALYRRREDPDYGRLRKSGSDGALDKLRDDEIRIRALDRELDGKRGRTRTKSADNRAYAHRKDNNNTHDIEPRQQINFEPRELPPPDPEMQTGYYATLPVGHDATESAKRRKKDKYRDELQLQMREAEAARQREKNERLRPAKEKNEGLKVNASGYLDPEKTSFRMRGLGETTTTPRRSYRDPEVVPYHTKFVSPRRGETSYYDQELDYGGGIGGGGLSGGGGINDIGINAIGTQPRDRGRSRRRHDLADGGILDKGFDGLIEPRRAIGSLQPPPGLQYQPSTYVTGSGGLGGGGAGYSSIDEAYHYFGMKNPLEPEGGTTVAPLNLGGGYDDVGGRRSPRPRVQFDDTPRRARDRSRERISPYLFPSDDDNRSRSRADKRDYQAELERQILENKEKKRREREEKERYERKIEEEMKTYNPYGKGGGGAPIRDSGGAPIADLRQMHLENIDPNSSRRRSPILAKRESPRYQPPGSSRDDLIHTPPPQQNLLGEQTHARGGHGIFGQPMTDAEKNQADKYKDDLRRQIEDKKIRAQKEREQQRIEEEKENRRIEEQRIRIAQEFEEETRKKREKEEEARRKNDEMRRQAEERKKDAERKKRDEQDRRNIERRDDDERERILSERHRDRVTYSPPIPALRTRDAIEGDHSDEQQRITSPPVPALRSKDQPSPATHTEDKRQITSPPIPALRSKQQTPTATIPRDPVPGPSTLSDRPNSSDVLKELAQMRKQLQSERRRVENALDSQKNEPEVFDPRMVARPPPKDIDVFERATQGAGSVPQRAQTSDHANPSNIHMFNELKYKDDTYSRRAFRSMFPEPPITNSALEYQQDALLRHQEEKLHEAKGGRGGTTGNPGTTTPKSLLQSQSAFIDVDGINHFPEDFDDMPKHNANAPQTRNVGNPRADSTQALNYLGSQTSLDVDKIQRKNEARLKRLQQMNADEVSMADPDDILDNFMAKQRYNRPPSGQTLQDDSWLRPGSKPI